MDRADLNRWYRQHGQGPGGDQTMLSPPTGDTAVSAIGGHPRMANLHHPPGPGMAEHSPTQAQPAGILPGLQMTSPGAGSFLSVHENHEQREMLAAAAAAAQSYPPFMWPSPLLPHPDLLAGQPNHSGNILSSAPLLLSETFPPYFGRCLPNLPESSSWRNAVTSPPSGSAAGHSNKSNSKRSPQGNSNKLSREDADISKKALVLSPKLNSEINKSNSKLIPADDVKRTEYQGDELSPKTHVTSSAASVDSDLALQVKPSSDSDTTQNRQDSVNKSGKASPTLFAVSGTLTATTGSKSKQLQTAGVVAVSTNTVKDNSLDSKSDVSSISRNGNHPTCSINSDILTIVTNTNSTAITATGSDSRDIREIDQPSAQNQEIDNRNSGDDKTSQQPLDTLTGDQLILETKLKLSADNRGDLHTSGEAGPRVGEKSRPRGENGSVQIQDKIKCKLSDERQEDTDTDIDVGDEMTSCSYQCSVSNGHGGKSGDVRRVHATTYTPEVGLVPDLLKTDNHTMALSSTTTAIDLTTTCSVNKSSTKPTDASSSKKEKAVVKHGHHSARSSMSSPPSASLSTSASSLSPAMLKSSDKLLSSLGPTSTLSQQQQKNDSLTPPNYMSFDPRILSFYTIEEREKLIQGGWIPACYSPNTKELPSAFGGIPREGLFSGVDPRMDTSEILSNVLPISAVKKVAVSGSETKKIPSDKKAAREGVSKRNSPAASTANTSTIPVGIAIARKRQDTSSEKREQERPLVEQSHPTTSETNTVQSRTNTTVTTTSSTAGLTSNLVVTGGSSEYWLGHGPYSLPPSTREGAQLQYNPPPGYKIAGDPITGQLYVIPDMTRGFGPVSPLPSPSSSLKSTDQHLSLESSTLDRRMTITPHPVLSPAHIHTPSMDINGRTSRTPSRSSSDETSRGRTSGSQDQATFQRSQESRSSSSSGGRDDGRNTSSAVSPPFRHSIASSAGSTMSTNNYSYAYPYYPYYWGQHAPPPLTTPVPASPLGNNSTQVRPPSRSNSGSTSTSHIHHPKRSSEPPSAKSKSTVSVQTQQNPVVEIGVQTCNNLVETSVQTDDVQNESPPGIDVATDSTDNPNATMCTCSCHSKSDGSTEKKDEGEVEDGSSPKEETSNRNNTDKSVSSDISADDNSDGLHILSTLASHLDFFTPITVDTEDDLSSVYNGPRSSYYNRGSFSGYRRVKTPSSDESGSVFRFGSDSMVSMEVEVRTRLAEIQRMYKEKQKQLGKLKRKDSEGGHERKQSRTKSRTASKSQSESDPLSPKAASVTSPKPMRKTKAQLKYMQHTPVVDFQETTNSENKDSEMEELRTMFEDTLLDSATEKTGEEHNRKTEGSHTSPLGGLPDSSMTFSSTPVCKPEKCYKRKSSQASEMSHAKKRKPGRPKKFGKGVTQTLVSKSSKHFSFMCFEDEDGSENETSSSNEEDETDDWRRRRSERIFLNDKTPVSPVKLERVPEAPMLTQKFKSKSMTQQNKELVRTKNLSEKVRKKYRNLEPTRKYSKQVVKTEKPTLSHSCSASSDDLPLTEIKTRISQPVIEDNSPAITEQDLKDSLKILYFMDGLFYEGSLKEIHPPDVYGVHVNGERGNRPHILPREEILDTVFLDVRVQDSNELPVGKRICAYWSQQFSCLYPGLVVEGVGLPKTARGRGLVNVEFDDGDTGKISVEHVRLLPQDFPFQGDSDDEPETPNKHRKSTEEKLPESWRERQPVRLEAPHVSHSSHNTTSFTPASPSSAKKFKRCNSTPTKRRKSTSASPRQQRSLSTSEKRKDDSESELSQVEEEEEELSEEGEEGGTSSGKLKVKRSPAKKKTVSVSGGQKKSNTVLPAHQIWQWQQSSRRLASKGKAKRTYYGAIQRGKEVIKVGESAVFLTVGRPHLPYIGRVECFYESRSGNMVVKVKWFYHPEETKGGKKLAEIRGALYESPHGDENDVQTISHKCHVMSYTRYKSYRQTHSANEMTNVYYLAGFYDPTISLIKFEGDVKLI